MNFSLITPGRDSFFILMSTLLVASNQSLKNKKNKKERNG